MHSDPIADMATRMRNALAANHKTTKVPHSTVKELVLKVLKSKGFIQDFEVIKEGKFEEILVTFSDKRGAFTIKRLSKPGHRIYRGARDIKPVQNGFGISVVSTSEGVMAGYEAYKKGIGGEILLEVY